MYKEISWILPKGWTTMIQLWGYESFKFPGVIRKFCKAPEDENIPIWIALGYEDDNLVNKFRAKKYTLEEVCHFFN